MTSITRVIKDLIDANTIAEIQKDVANGTATIGITNVIYTDENFANTANTTLATTGGHIRVLGYGFEPNLNVEIANSALETKEANTYYVNFKECRAEIPSINVGTYSVFVYNSDGKNAVSFNSINVV
jgi:hypothetical protein